MEAFYVLLALSFVVVVLLFFVLLFRVILWISSSLGSKIEEKVSSQRGPSYCWFVTLIAIVLSVFSFVLLGVVGILPTWWLFKWVRLAWREQDLAFSSGAQSVGKTNSLGRP